MNGSWPRQLPPAHAPLSPGALAGAALCGFPWHADPRPEFRSFLCSLFAADDALLVDSGTHALELALRLAVNDSGHAVVALPAYTCYDVATAAVGAGVRIALYDLDPDTLAPDLDSLDRALGMGARVAIVSPLYGIPVDWDAIERCAAMRHALLIEDAAQGHGSSWRERRLGSLGSISVLSFGRGKGWTGGCGGALLVRSGVALARDGVPLAAPPPAPAFAGFPAASGQWALSRPQLFGLAASLSWLHLGETRYRDPDSPRSMPPTAAGLLQRTFGLATRESEARRANAAEFIAALSNLTTAVAHRVRRVLPPSHAVPGYLRFPIRLSRGLEGVADLKRARRLGLATAYPTSLSALAAVRERMVAGPGATQCTGAETLVRELITLPAHSLVSARDRRELLRLVGVS